MYAYHTFGPIFNENSRILILGSFPSVKSREIEFYYGHPQNRFWRVLAAVLHSEPPESIPEKTAFLLRNRIALWDVIESCEIKGSSDVSIKNVTPNDLGGILHSCDIRQIYVNGNKAASLYRKHILPVTGRDAITLPSTSPANAAYSLDRLIELWNVIFEKIQNEPEKT